MNAPPPRDKPMVLVIDDHPIVRAGCQRLLEPQHQVIEAADAAAGLALYQKRRPAAVVLDLGLPGMGGLEALRRLKSLDPDAKTLIFSMHDDLVYATRALDAGAVGYVTKHDAPTELAAAVAAVLQGRVYLSRDIAQDLALRGGRQGRGDDPLAAVSAREIEILRLLGGGADLSGVAAALAVSYKTIANACVKLRRRLGVKRTADLIRLAVERGLVDDPRPKG